MKKGLFLFPSVFALSLSACAGVHHEISEYILELQYKSNYRILQLTDTHIGDKDNTKLHYDFIDLTINEAHPDLIVITGDVFTYASKNTVKEFFKYMDGHGVPWTLTFGNHDEQGYYSIDWLTGVLNKYGSHCYFKDIQDDDVQGNANFAINLMNGTNVFEQLIIMDSNRYNYNGYFGYDYFHQDQIDWYKDLVRHTKDQNGGTVVPSLMFYHIPLPEVRDAWAAAQADPSLVKKPTSNVEGKVGEQNEDPCNPDYNSGFFEEIKKAGSTHGMYFGHDHINNYIVTYEGIDFGYGIKATDRVYASDQLLGGRVIELHDDHSVSYFDYYHQYEEVK